VRLYWRTVRKYLAEDAPTAYFSRESAEALPHLTYQVSASRSSRGIPSQESATPVRAGSAGLDRMTTMAVIGITGSTDGIGRATARVLLADGHRVLVHARS
jgi:hypothetical protein